MREDRGRGRGGPRKHGGLTVSGEAAAKQSQKPFKPSARDKGPQRRCRDGNPAAFRTWYVPEGVDTGPTGHRNPDGRGPKKPYGKKPRPGGAGAGPNPYGGFSGERRGPGGGGAGKPQRSAKPYGHPGNAPSFPSDHANPGGFNPYGDRARTARPGGPKPGGRPGGKPGGKPAGKPGGPRPGGPRPGGPRGGGRPGGGGRGGPRG